jgi:hypothetical protein
MDAQSKPYRRFLLGAGLTLLAATTTGISGVRASGFDALRDTSVIDARNLWSAVAEIKEGRRVFRYDTFGDEAFWGGTLRLHEAIVGISPTTALELGLKIDVKALPRPLRRDLRNGRVDLKDPGVTLALVRLGAVVGVTGFFDDYGELESVGIQCALCHSDVDDSLAEGIGRRLDGWANRDLNVGAIIAAAPEGPAFFAELLGVSEETVRTVLKSWGPGKFDAELLIDGKALRPDGKPAATLIPPAFGLAGMNLHTWTGWGGVPHWNAFVAVLEMGGQGTFYDPRLKDDTRFPIAAANGFDDVRPAEGEDDLVTSKLPALHLYQLSLAAPEPPTGSFDAQAAERGEALFNGKADCVRCHVPPLYTEPGWNLHTPGEIGIDAFQAERSPDRGYRTSPLKGLWTHTKGGFYHDGRFADLEQVIQHYEDAGLSPALSGAERSDLVEFLKSL